MSRRMSSDDACMIVTGWHNGQYPQASGGYGLRLRRDDRDRFLPRRVKAVVLVFPDGHRLEIPLSDSFWRQSTELRSATIGRWLLRNKLAPWPWGEPPKFELSDQGGGVFTIGRRVS